VKAAFCNAVDYIRYLVGRLRLGEAEKAGLEALVDAGATFPALPEVMITGLVLPSLGESSP